VVKGHPVLIFKDRDAWAVMRLADPYSPPEAQAAARAAAARFAGTAAFACADCGVNVLATGQYYILRAEVWRQVMPGIDGNLCLPCCEARLGRALTPADFDATPEDMARVLAAG
jgi:hypothetical protein